MNDSKPKTQETQPLNTYPNPTCMDCGEECDIWEEVETNCGDEIYSDIELWNYCKPCGVETFHQIPRMEADKMRFVFDKGSAKINFGNCSKLNKEVSFIPNHCQIETQVCFVHRRDLK